MSRNGTRRVPLGDDIIRPTFNRERYAMKQGIFPIAGCDEAGRGPLAGPVVAAAVILDPKTGKMELMPEDKADMDAPSWDDQGRVVVAAQFLRSSLWRFQPDK